MAKITTNINTGDLQKATLNTQTFEYSGTNIFVLSNVINNILQVIVNTTSLHPIAYEYTIPNNVTILNELFLGDTVTIVYNYLEDVNQVYNLQAVTDEGNHTTNNIVLDNLPGENGDYTTINTLNDLGTFQSFTSPTNIDYQTEYAGYGMYINEIYSPTESKEMLVAQGFIQTSYTNGDTYNSILITSSDPAIEFGKNGFIGKLKSDNIEANITLQFPAKPLGTYTIATTEDVPPFTPSDYDLDEFTNTNADPFAKISDLPTYSDFIQDSITNGVVDKAPTENAVYDALQLKQNSLGYTPVNKAGDTMSGDLILNRDPEVALGAATKQYVDNISSGINFHEPVVVATDLPLVATYNNGTAGVGATLTGPSVGALSIDGEFPAYLDRVLVWQQANPIQNGIYDLTTVGDSVTVYQLTRSTDADNSPPGEMRYGDYTFTTSGDVNGGRGFICNTTGVIVIGTTPITFVQFNSAQIVTPGYGLENTSPNVIAIDPAVTQEKISLTTTGSSGAATFTGNTLNIPQYSGNPGTITSITASSPLTGGTITSSGTISLPQATTSVSGYLSSTDWNTFNGKAPVNNPTFTGSVIVPNATLSTQAVNKGQLDAAIPSFLEFNSVNSTVWNNGKGNIATNLSFGDFALNSVTTGYGLVAYGNSALRATDIGAQSVAVGNNTLTNSTSGSYNVAIGASSMAAHVSGDNNIAIGSTSGNLYALNNNSVFLGNGANAQANSQTNQIVIGNNAVGAGSNTATLGNDSITSTILKGLVKAPLTTNALIDADSTGKAITTKEYLTTYTAAQLAGKMNNPSLTASYIPKALTATTIGNSRIIDTGTYFGFDTFYTPTKFFTLGNQVNREVGIEESDNNTIGRNLTLQAGRTINYLPNSDFNNLNQVAIPWSSITVSILGNAYAAQGDCGFTSQIYKQTGGVGNFEIINGSPVKSWSSMTTDLITGNMYASSFNFGIYKSISGSDTFTLISESAGFSFSGVAVSPNGDVYGTVRNGDIYKQTGGIGSFVALNQIIRIWNGITAYSNGNIYAVVNNGDIYMQTGGTGNFVALNQTSRAWSDIKYANGNVYATFFGGIAMQNGGTGNFNVISGVTSRNYGGIAIAPNNNIYAVVGGKSCTDFGGIFMQNNDSLGSPNLSGGTLKLTSGTGKGTGASDIEMWTGQVKPSGTDMQDITLRAKINNTGLMTLPSVTNALIEADTTYKSVVTKEYVNNRLVLEKSGNYTLTNADSGGIIIFTASATLTIPNSLADGFECTFVTLASATLTVDRGSNILYNNTGTVLLPQFSFTLKRRIATDQYITAGSL